MSKQAGAATNGKGVEVGTERARLKKEPSHFLADVLPEQVWTAKPNGTLDFVNQRMLDYFGCSFEELIGDGWQQMLHPDDLPRTLERWDKAFETGEICEVKFRLQRADGAYRWHVARAQPQRNAEGEIVRWFGCNTDIHDQRQAEEEALRLQRAEEALLQSEERYRTLFESIDEGFCILEMIFDEDGTPVDYRFVETNPAFEKQTGLIDAVGQTARELVPDLEAHWIELYGRVAVTGEPERFVEGSEAMGRWFDVYACRLGGDESRKVALQFKDITVQKRAEEERERLIAELETERGRLRNIFQQAPVAIAVTRGPEHVYEMANPHYVQLIGRPDLTGRPVRDVFPEAEGQGSFGILDRVVETGEPWVASEFPITLDRGEGPEERFFNIVYHPLTNVQGEATGAVTVAVEVTEQVRARRQVEAARDAAEAANRAKSSFLANMSHEIRTPLTSIVGFTSFLAQQLSGRQLKYVEMIERSGKRLLDTLNALLMLARLEAKGMEIAFEDVNVAEEAERVAGLFRPKAEEKGLMLEFKDLTGSRAPLASLDAGALNSILQNLVSNAVKFTDAGQVRVTTEVVKHSFPNTNNATATPTVRVCVEDTGSGIDGEFLERIFESFEQESSGWSRSHEGSGLGLSITQKLVELMNGTISIESEKGDGSTFTVAFPLTPENEATFPMDETQSNPVIPSDAHILVVEDQEEASLLVEDILSGAEEIVTTATGAGALDAARATRFDLVLVDINLGTVESGVDVLRALEQMPEYEEVPIVAVTAYALPGDREEFLQEGFDAYLSKPFMANELLELACRLLRR